MNASPSLAPTAPAERCPERFAELAPELAPRDFTARFRRRARGVGAQRAARIKGRRALVALVACAVPALAAPQDWRLFDVGNAAGGELALMPFERPGESFPGSAFYYLMQDAAAEAPRLDATAHWDGEQFAGPVAKELRAAGSPVDRMRALTCLTQAIYYEAASEPDAGQRAVAQVVLNRVAHPAYPKSVCGVVYQGSDRPTGCQFTFACDGALARLPNRLFWLRAESVARSALAGYVYAPVGLATHYHTIAVHPYWADSLNYVGTIGAHRFYRFGGPAGAPATFNTAAYRGGEPIAAPLPRSDSSLTPDSSLDPLAIEQAFARGYAAAQGASGEPGVTGPGMISGLPGANGVSGTNPARGTSAPHAAPSYAPALEARGGDALYTARTLPGSSSDVRPEYAQSGQWIARPGT